MTKPDLTLELAQLLSFAADTARAIRTYSQYTRCQPSAGGEVRDPAHAPEDLMFLSDAICQLLDISKAVEEGNHTRTITMCQYVAELFESHLTANADFKMPANPTFAFWKDQVKLRDAIQALQGIQAKTQAFIAVAA